MLAILVPMVSVFVGLTLGTIRSHNPIVNTQSGRVRGIQQIVKGKAINTFLGIPFAKPPINDLRFKRPVSVEPWSGIVEATNWPKSCPHLLYGSFPGNPGEEVWNSMTGFNEDCLYLNVWAPTEQTTDPKSTMIWIFGGGFVSGTISLDLYDGKTLAAEENVIVVSINYRLGPLGFLYFGNDEAPGNMGLLDQVLAIEWIYNNIEVFGGAKGHITLFGESAGSSSVHFQMLSTHGNRFFDKVILESGSALSPWAYQEPTFARSVAKQLARKVRCDQQSDEAIIQCLRQKSADTLVNEQWNLNLDWKFTTFPFVPTMDNYFITDSPINIVTSNTYKKRPILAGVNKNEASFFIIYGVTDDIARTGAINQSLFMTYLHHTIDINLNKVTLSAIENEYIGKFQPRINFMQILDDIGGDYAFKCPTLQVVRSRAEVQSNIYLYSFEHRMANNPWPQWTGVLHGDEIFFIFGKPLEQVSNYTDEERELSSRMMKYWANFAKSGNPNIPSLDDEAPTWPQYDLLNESYLRIVANGNSTGVGLKHKECTFWIDFMPELQGFIRKKCTRPRPPTFL